MNIYNCNSEMGEFNPELNVQDETDELVEETEKIDSLYIANFS